MSTDDTKIRFFEQSPDGDVVWEAYLDVKNEDVHLQVARKEFVCAYNWYNWAI